MVLHSSAATRVLPLAWSEFDGVKKESCGSFRVERRFDESRAFAWFQGKHCMFPVDRHAHTRARHDDVFPCI